MSYCPKCGAELKDNDQFCTICGTKTNLSQNNMNEGQSQRPVNTDQFGEYFKEILSVVIGVLSKPASTIRYAAKDFKAESSFIFAGIIVILQSLLSLIGIKQILNGTRSISAIFSNLFGRFLGGYNVSYGKIFAVTLFSLIIMLFALSGIVFFMGKYAFKGQGNFLSIWKVVVCAYAAYVLFGLASTILSYIGTIIGQIVMIAGVLIFILLLFIGTMESMGVGDDKAVYILSTSIMVTFLILYIILRIYINSRMRGINF